MSARRQPGNTRDPTVLSLDVHCAHTESDAEPRVQDETCFAPPHDQESDQQARTEAFDLRSPRREERSTAKTAEARLPGSDRLIGSGSVRFYCSPSRLGAARAQYQGLGLMYSIE